MEHFSLSEWLGALGYAALAAVAGFLGHIMRELDAGRRLSPVRVVIETLGSGLVGFLVMLLCRAMGFDPLWSGFLVGIFGWVGASASIRIIERLAYGKLGIAMKSADQSEGDRS